VGTLSGKHEYPAVWLARNQPDLEIVWQIEHAYFIGSGSVVRIVQYPTREKAREVAGSEFNTFPTDGLSSTVANNSATKSRIGWAAIRRSRSSSAQVDHQPDQAIS